MGTYSVFLAPTPDLRRRLPPRTVPSPSRTSDAPVYPDLRATPRPSLGMWTRTLRCPSSMCRWSALSAGGKITNPAPVYDFARDVIEPMISACTAPLPSCASDTVQISHALSEEYGEEVGHWGRRYIRYELRVGIVSIPPSVSLLQSLRRTTCCGSQVHKRPTPMMRSLR